MSKEILKKIGTAFNTHKTENINKEGIGLGLFICNIIVNQMGPSKKLEI
jgi:K+-sensing histidine kinase KdpD